MKNVLVVDERDIIREKLCGILSRIDTIRFVIQVSSLEKVDGFLPLMDIDLLLMDSGITRNLEDFINDFRNQQPNAQIVIYMDMESEAYRKSALARGAHMVVTIDDLRETIEKVSRTEHHENSLHEMRTTV